MMEDHHVTYLDLLSMFVKKKGRSYLADAVGALTGDRIADFLHVDVVRRSHTS